MAEEIEQIIEEGPKSKIIVKRDLYMMGKKGGLRVEVREKNDGNRYLRFGKWWEAGNMTFVINQEKHWRSLKRVIDGNFAEFLGWSGYDIKPVAPESYISLKEHDQILNKKDREIRQRTKELNQMGGDLARIRKNLEKTQKQQIKTKIPEYKRNLKIFKKLLETSRVERELHNFLRENYWIFGPQYVTSRSEQKIGFKNRSDFLLERIDGYYDIVELKKSKSNIFSRKKFSGESKNAVSQMITYLHKCDTLYNAHFVELGLDILKPEGKIIIGRSEKEVLENLRIHNSFLNNLKIITYDQLLNSANQMIKKFEE